MTTTHNQGRLRVGTESSTLISDTDGPGVRGYDDPSYGGYLVAESIHPTNAPRLAACWNACQGIPTDALQKVDGDTTPVFQLLMDTWAERDANAAQLHALVQFFDEWEQILPHDAREALRPLAEQARGAPMSLPEPEPLPPPPSPICTNGCDHQENGSGGWVCTRCGDWLPF